MDSRWLGVIVLLIIVALGGWYVFAHPSNGPAATDMNGMDMASTTTASSTTSAMAPAPVTVTYTDQGFSPKSVAVVAGQTVTFVNQSSANMWVASDPHPTHSGYDGTSRTTHCAAGYTGAAPFDECAMGAPGTSWSFTFTKAGTWGYHDHAHDSMHGTVVVTAPAADGSGVSASTTVNVELQ